MTEMDELSYIDIYATLWSGILLGMFLAHLFNSILPPMGRWWHFGFSAFWLLTAFLVRPFIYSMASA